MLFLTSRGLKHNFTGFLHVPPGGDPTKFFEFEDKPPSQLVRYGERLVFRGELARLSLRRETMERATRETASAYPVAVPVGGTT